MLYEMMSMIRLFSKLIVCITIGTVLMLVICSTILESEKGAEI